MVTGRQCGGRRLLLRNAEHGLLLSRRPRGLPGGSRCRRALVLRLHEPFTDVGRHLRRSEGWISRARETEKPGVFRILCAVRLAGARVLMRGRAVLASHDQSSPEADTGATAYRMRMRGKGWGGDDNETARAKRW